MIPAWRDNPDSELTWQEYHADSAERLCSMGTPVWRAGRTAVHHLCLQAQPPSRAALPCLVQAGRDETWNMLAS